MLTEKTIVIVRHAHRNKKNGSETDNGLSKKGETQAKQIKRYFDHTFKTKNLKILSSPKKRCIETVERIAKSRKIIIEASPLLDEGSNGADRVNLLVSRLENEKAPLIVLCSHGDLIPILLQRLVGSKICLDKAGWAQLEGGNGTFELRWLIQDLNFMRTT